MIFSGTVTLTLRTTSASSSMSITDYQAHQVLCLTPNLGMLSPTYNGPVPQFWRVGIPDKDLPTGKDEWLSVD